MSDLGERWWSYLVSAVAIGAVLYPLQTDPQVDSFPLSTYPMFTAERPPFADIDHVVGVGRGRRAPIPPGLVASGEVLQAKVAVAETLRRGRRGAQALCRQVAERVAQSGDLGWVEHLEVRSDRYQVLGYFSSARAPVTSRLHARCPIER